MSGIGTATIQVLPDIDGRAFTDAAVLIAGVRLHEAMYHADIAWLMDLPAPVQAALGDLQDAIGRVVNPGRGSIS